MNNACDPMFLSWFIALGPFLLLAARKPSSHRSLITFAACQCLVHASIMAVQTAEAWKHGVHRQFADVVLIGIIGAVLLALLLPRREQPAVVTE
jgi:hydrogenase-4 membrane subunit HyfE